MVCGEAASVPRPQDRIHHIERQIQECIDAGLVEEYKQVVAFVS